LTDQLQIAIQALHPGILVVLMTVYVRYGLRAKLLAEELAGCNGLIENIRMRIGMAMNEDLMKFLVLPPVTSIILPAGVELRPSPADRLKGEDFRNALSSFVLHGGADLLSDLRTALLAKECWQGWAGWLSWGIVTSLLAEFLIILVGMVLLFVDRAIFEVLLPFSLASSIVPFSCLCMLIPLHINYDRLVKLKARYSVS